MDKPQRLICASEALADGGDGVRFEIEHDGELAPAFAVRFGGKVYAYLNRCAHVALELDWTQGRFFDSYGLYLICATHGATYLPENGRCIAGPCKGARLTAIPVTEISGKVFLE